MALVHSLWTAPMLAQERGAKTERQIITTVWCAASSVAYAQRLNTPIHLYADDFAKQMLAFLPYSKIYTLSVPEWVPTLFWAAGKFFAYKQMPLGDVHIDTDVFIKTPQCLQEIERGRAQNDLIVQCTENQENCIPHYYTIINRIFDDYRIRFEDIPTNKWKLAYNCGLVGFNNYTLKEKYINHYINALHKLRTNPPLLQELKDNGCAPDLVLEQQHLYHLARGYKVCNLLGRGEASWNKSHKIGYQHILGDGKWNCLDLIQQQLSIVNPLIYLQTKKHIQKLLNNL